MKVEDYLKLLYTIEVTQDESDGYTGWFAKVEELPGCMTQADTFDELGEMIEDAKRAWIESALEDGVEIPLPRRLGTRSAVEQHDEARNLLKAIGGRVSDSYE